METHGMTAKQKAAAAKKKRIAQGLKDLAENRARNKKKKDTRSVDDILGKAPKKPKAKKKQSKKKTTKKTKSAEDLVADLRKGKGHLLRKNK